MNDKWPALVEQALDEEYAKAEAEDAIPWLDAEPDLVIVRSPWGWTMLENRDAPFEDRIVSSAEDWAELVAYARKLGLTTSFLVQKYAESGEPTPQEREDLEETFPEERGDEEQKNSFDPDPISCTWEEFLRDNPGLRK